MHILIQMTLYLNIYCLASQFLIQTLLFGFNLYSDMSPFFVLRVHLNQIHNIHQKIVQQQKKLW